MSFQYLSIFSPVFLKIRSVLPCHKSQWFVFLSSSKWILILQGSSCHLSGWLWSVFLSSSKWILIHGYSNCFISCLLFSFLSFVNKILIVSSFICPNYHGLHLSLHHFSIFIGRCVNWHIFNIWQRIWISFPFFWTLIKHWLMNVSVVKLIYDLGSGVNWGLQSDVICK